MRTAAKLFLLAASVIAFGQTARSQDSLDCLVPGIQDFRTMPAHLNQADIVSGKTPLADVIAAGSRC